MRRYLLFDSQCLTCTTIARQVEHEAGGWLTVASLHDPVMRKLLDHHRPGWSFRPTLIIVDDERIKVLTGAALSLRIAAALGPRRAAKVARLVMGPSAATAQGAGAPTRRALLKGAAAGAAALLGLALTPKAATADGGPDARVLTGDDLDQVLRTARRNADYRRAVAAVGSAGFATREAEAVALRGTDGRTLLYAFFDSPTAPETTAAAVAHEIDTDGSTRTIAERTSRDASVLSSDAPVGVGALSATRIFSSGPQTMDAAAYFACMFGCVGVNCAGPAANCIRIPNLVAALACIAGFCGWRAYRCHSLCRHAW